MTDAYAVAVDRYLDALTRFDAPMPPLPPRVVDWCEHREVTVPAEEAELEARFGCTTRSAGGGGETRSPAEPMATDFNHRAQARHYRRLPGIRKAVEAGRFGWRGLAARLAADEQKAAEVPLEEERTMPRGVKLDEAAILGALDTTGRTAKGIAEKLGVCEGPVAKRLRELEQEGRAKKVGGGTGVGPGVWAAVSTPMASGAPAAKAPPRKGNGKGVSTSKPSDPERGATSEELYGVDPAHGMQARRPLCGSRAAMLEMVSAEVDSEAKFVAARMLREVADRLEAEASGSAT